MSADKFENLQTGIAMPEGASLVKGQGGLPMVKVKTSVSTAEIYLHGAHVTHFQKTNEPPLLWLSRESKFDEASPIRGGIPIILPWFGARAGKPAHGFARVKAWELKKATVSASGRVRLHFRLPQYPEAAEFPAFTADYFVTVNETLELQLIIANATSDREFEFEECLHTYFTVGDISAVSVVGLKGTKYLDKVLGFAEHTETNESIAFAGEVDRVYLNTTSAADIRDGKLRRKIRVEKEGSNSTVVWNPWIDKAKAMPDFGDEEYRGMVCVESGNVSRNKKTLGPGKTAMMTVRLSSSGLD